MRPGMRLSAGVMFIVLLRERRDCDQAFWSQVAEAAQVSEAEESQDLCRLAQSGAGNSSAAATAVHDCRYRPYIARQVVGRLLVQPHSAVQPLQAPHASEI